MSATLRSYRAIVREINKSSLSARATRKNKVIGLTFRTLFEEQRQGLEKARFDQDVQNAATFMRSQRVYKELLDRYNPLHDLTTEERVKATARRVGLDMPLNSSNKES